MQKVDLLFIIHEGSGLVDSVVELANVVKQVCAGAHAKLLVNVVELGLRAGDAVGIIKAKVEVLLEARPKALPAVGG
jgi:late competence protein required for DNA uptake (superfamily II DNA/RNA helicase)